MGFIRKEMRRANRNLLLTSLLLCVLALGVLALARGYLYNCVAGPFPTPLDQITNRAKLGDFAGRFARVAINLAQVEHTGYDVIGGRRAECGDYFFLRLPDDRLLVVRGEVSGVLDGEVEELSGNEAVGKMSFPPSRGVCSLMLDAAGYREGMIAIIAGCLPLLVLASWGFKRVAKWISTPEQHPIMKQLAVVGSPQEMAANLDLEVANAQRCGGQMQATKSWLLRRRIFGMDLMHVDSILWMHSRETFHTANGIRTCTSYRAIIYGPGGRTFACALPPQEGGAWMRTLATRVPWAFAGDDPTARAMWGRHSAELTAAVAQRRKKYEQDQTPQNVGQG